MKKLLISLWLLPVLAFGQQINFPGGVNSNQVYNIIQSIGINGAAVSNEVKALTVANYYTNATPHYAEVHATISMAGASGYARAAVTNTAANTRFFVYDVPSLSVSAITNTLVFTVPPSNHYKVSGVGMTVADGAQVVVYYATNSSSGGGGSGDVTAAGLAAGSYAINGALATNFNYLPVYNVENFGADHNPAGTNDHWAVQSAIDFARTNSNGGIIYFPRGDYWFTNRTFHPTYVSENSKSAITLWSNCVWVLEGENATIKLQDTSSSSGAGDFVLIGSGNHSGGANFNWNAANLIHLKGLTFDMMDTTFLYDMVEVHNGDTFIAENCKFVNNRFTSADAIDANGNSVIATGCLFSNWNGSIFHPDNNAAGVAIFQNCYVTNCNTDFTLNTGFDASGNSAGFDIVNCDFRNVGKVIVAQAGKLVRIRDSSFTFMSHASIVTATNIFIQGEAEITGCRFVASGTANSIGCIVGETTSVLTIRDCLFINIKAVWATNLLAFTFSDNYVVSGIQTFRLGGSGREHYKISNNRFYGGISGLIACFEASTANNVVFNDNILTGNYAIASGTNWSFINNVVHNTGTAYLSDGSFGNSRFIGNITIPAGNAANELRLGGASNYVSGNVVNDVQILASGCTGTYFCDNVIGTGALQYFAGSDSTFNSGGAVIQRNHDRTGSPMLLSSPLYQAVVWQTTNLTTTVLDMTKGSSTIAMAANITLTDPTGVSSLGKYAQTHTAIITNSSVGEKTITVPASWFNMSSATATIYNTNKGVLTVTVYPGAGTNYTWSGR